MARKISLSNVVTLVLVVLVVPVAAFVLLDRTPTTYESKEREQHLVPVYRRDALQEITFEGESGAFKLVRDQTGVPSATAPDAGPDARTWRIEQSGQSEPADPLAVDQAVQNLENAAPVRTIAPAEVDRARFGLSPARRTITVTMGALRTRLSLGGPAPRPDGAIYVDIDGVVKVVKRTALDRLDAPADAFRSRQVAPYLTNDVKQISLVSDGPEHKEAVIERLAGASWKLASGPLAGTRVDRFGFERIITAFADLKADHFLSQAARPAEGATPRVTVTLVPTAAGPSGVFTVGGACPEHPDEVYVARTAPRPLTACAAKGGLDALRRGDTELADARVFGLREDEFEEVTLEQGDRKLDIARKGNAWKQRLPVEADVAADQARALVRALGQAHGEAPTRQAPEGFAPVARVSVRGPRENEEARPTEVVELGAAARDGSVWVRRQQDGAFVLLDRDQARPFFPRVTSLRSTSLVGEAVDRVRSIRIHEGTQLRQELTRSADGVWKLATPKGFDVDLGIASELTENLLHLSAEQWVADKDDGSFGLAQPRFRAEFTVDEGADAGVKNYHLAIGEVTGASDYARLDGVEGVFLVPRALEQTLTSLALDLGVFQLNLDEIDRLEFKRPDAPPLTLLVRQNQLRTPDGAPELPPSRLEAIKAALGDLRAQLVAHTGPARPGEGLDRPTLTITAHRTGPGGDITLTMGASDVLRSTSVTYARRQGLDATYAIAAARVRALLAAL